MKKNEETKPSKLFLVWSPSEDGNPGYFNQFETMEDALDGGGNGTEIYEAPVKYLGLFKKQTVIMEIPEPKKRGRPARKKK